MKRKGSELSWQGTEGGQGEDRDGDIAQGYVLPICIVKTDTGVAQMHHFTPYPVSSSR